MENGGERLEGERRREATRGRERVKKEGSAMQVLERRGQVG